MCEKNEISIMLFSFYISLDMTEPQCIMRIQYQPDTLAGPLITNRLFVQICEVHSVYLYSNLLP